MISRLEEYRLQTCTTWDQVTAQEILKMASDLSRMNFSLSNELAIDVLEIEEAVSPMMTTGVLAVDLEACVISEVLAEVMGGQIAELVLVLVQEQAVVVEELVLVAALVLKKVTQHVVKIKKALETLVVLLIQEVDVVVEVEVMARGKIGTVELF